MISRRLIRIKVFKVLFSHISSGSDSFLAAEKELLLSCSKTLELYYFILSLPLALKKVAQQKIEVGLKKHQPTPEDLNPNRKFVDNRLILLLDEDIEFKTFCSKRGLNWLDHISFVKKIYKTLSETSYFEAYMSSGNSSLEEDIKLICTFFEEELEYCEELESILEDSNLYWIDDLAFVINTITKKLYSIKKEEVFSHPSIFLKEEDKDYAIRLLNVSMIRYNEYSKLIAEYAINWKAERLASVDLLLIVMGIAEAVSFPNIPMKVTINEYVELSKFYSTPNSKVFVNGMLDKVLMALKEEGKIEKSGRGLVGSVE
ncbi:MAG: transcription antitermination protein NusB [Bacteroidales bacterium]|nr:transcription antitermination protein NusB [Bacteroidales bacterium]